jgi:hypothetical protein
MQGMLDAPAGFQGPEIRHHGAASPGIVADEAVFGVLPHLSMS